MRQPPSSGPAVPAAAASMTAPTQMTTMALQIAHHCLDQLDKHGRDNAKESDQDARSTVSETSTAATASQEEEYEVLAKRLQYRETVRSTHFGPVMANPKVTDMVANALSYDDKVIQRIREGNARYNKKDKKAQW